MTLCTKDTGATLLGKPFILIGYLMKFSLKAIGLFGLMYLLTPIWVIGALVWRMFYKYNVCDCLGGLYEVYEMLDGATIPESIFATLSTIMVFIILADLFGYI